MLLSVAAGVVVVSLAGVAVLAAIFPVPHILYRLVNILWLWGLALPEVPPTQNLWLVLVALALFMR